MIIFLICIGLFVYYSRNRVTTAGEDTISDSRQETAEHEKWKELTRKEIEAELRAELQKKADAKTALRDEQRFVPGWITITDPWGREAARFRSAVVGDGWLALPTRACLSGSTWRFSSDSGNRYTIAGGLWVYGDSAGLWRFDRNSPSERGPELGVWNEKNPVAWASLESDRTLPFVMPKAVRSDGFFLASSVPESINEIGIFTQEGNVVGWSFGDWLDQAFMWKGQKTTALKERTWVSSFYSITFANSREEKFAEALSIRKDDDGMEQLSAFIDGFRSQPKLAPEDTPFYLLPEEVIGNMRHILTAAFSRGGYERTIISLFDSRALKSIGDLNLVMDIVPSIKSVYGYEPAIRELEDSGLSILREQGHIVPAFTKLHAELYQNWLQALVSEEAVNRGLRAYDSAKTYFPDDPYIHLLGVELEILNGDLEEAERLLYMRNYPPEFQDRFSLLALRISELKGDEGQVVVRFPRGSSRIIVTAVVNGASDQEFLVDTGASMVTIPSSAVETLGLRIIEGYHGGKRSVSTAAGVVTASEVMIDAIEINGWTEYDVRALVLDMPDQPGLGLLGLNYLGRFQVDLRPDEGVLKLTPR